jgi:hypothetical protein
MRIKPVLAVIALAAMTSDIYAAPFRACASRRFINQLYAEVGGR